MFPKLGSKQYHVFDTSVGDWAIANKKNEEISFMDNISINNTVTMFIITAGKISSIGLCTH